MHLQANLLSLEQRRRRQLMYLMFIYKNRHDNIGRIYPRNTRGANVFSFVRERYNNMKYKNSPYYKGSLIWDELPHDVRRAEILVDFKKLLSKHYVRYDQNII